MMRSRSQPPHQHNPHGVTQWRVDRLATALVIPATPVLIAFLFLWQRNFVLNPAPAMSDTRVLLLLSFYLVLMTFFNLMSLKAIIDDYVKSIRLRWLCGVGLMLFVVWLPLVSLSVLYVKVWQ